MKADTITTFRVHFSDGEKILVSATSPDEARTKARRLRAGGIVTKVKKVRES